MQRAVHNVVAAKDTRASRGKLQTRRVAAGRRGLLQTPGVSPCPGPCRPGGQPRDNHR